MVTPAVYIPLAVGREALDFQDSSNQVSHRVLVCMPAGTLLAIDAIIDCVQQGTLGMCTCVAGKWGEFGGYR